MIAGLFCWLVLVTLGQVLVEVEFAGDLALARGIGPSIARHEGGGSGFFRPLRRHLAEVDLAVANLEGVARSARNPRAAPGKYDLSFDNGFLELLRETGFQAFGLANNHALDAGSPGLAATDEGLRGMGLTPMRGAVVLQVKGVELRILAVDLTPGRVPATGWTTGEAEWRFAVTAESEQMRLIAVVSKLAQGKRGPLFLFFHGGLEDTERVSQKERRFFESLIDAGVDGIFGHHAHRMKPGGFLKGRPCFPGLGSVLFDRSRVPDCYGAVVRVTVWAGIPVGWRVFPVHIRARTWQPIMWPAGWLERKPWNDLFPVNEMGFPRLVPQMCGK